MLNLNNFTVNNQVSLNSLLVKRQELSNSRQLLISECVKLQRPFDKSYLTNPVYMELQNQLTSEATILSDLNNCLSLYYTHKNIAGKPVVDDRPEVNIFMSFEKATKKSFDAKKHKLGFLIIANKLNAQSLSQGIHEESYEDFIISVEPNQKHKFVEDRFETISHAMYVCSNFWAVRDYVRKGYRIVYGYRNENNQFLETGYIS